MLTLVYNPRMPRIEKHPPGAFSWIELATTDQNGAKTFYTSLFGWEVIDNPMGPNEVYTMFKLQGAYTGAAYTMPAEQRSQGVPPNWMIYVATASADQSVARAAELGGKIIAPAFDVFDFGRMAVLQDPTGALFSIWEAKQHHGMGIAGEPGTFCWADLSTADVDTAKRFYEGLFGWQIAPGEKDTSGYLHIKNGDNFIGGIPPSKFRDPNVPPHWMIYIMVSDCDSTAAKAKELGGAIHMPPSTMENVGRMSILADPQGAVFALFQPLPRS
jgi:predicted enzyme related to lactoylglutathione lyase